MALIPKKSTSSSAVKADAELSEFKGNVLITLPINGRASSGKPFTMGRAKAKTILMYLEELREFVDTSDAELRAQLED